MEPEKAMEKMQSQVLLHARDVISCTPATTLEEAASLMEKKQMSCVIITVSGRPEGILTDKDLRRLVASGKAAGKTRVREIMTSPVHTFPPQITVEQARMAMLQHRITHLVLTEDGSAETVFRGVILQEDILLNRDQDPAHLLGEILDAGNIQQLAAVRSRADKLIGAFIQEGFPVEFLCLEIAVLNKGLTSRVIELCLEKSKSSPPVPFSWISLGSQGRGEQLLPTDQDHALVFEDVPDAEFYETQKWFLSLAEEVSKALNEIGFSYCPAEMMADNPLWCKSVSHWKKQFGNWIAQPDEQSIMHSAIFFDFRVIYGEEHFIDDLAEHIRQSLQATPLFLNYLGVNTLKSPVTLSILGRFKREWKGPNHGSFDLKARLLMPMVDAARLLVLSHGIKDPKNTLERYRTLEKLEPQNEKLFESCGQVIQMLIQIRNSQGLKHRDTGRYIRIGELSGFEKAELRFSVQTLKTVQQLILVRFQLAGML